MLTVLKVFCFATVIDIMWVLYILAASKRKRFLACVVSMMMGAPAIFGLLEIFNNRLMAVPYLLGLGFGTFVGMEIDKWLEKNLKRDGREN